MFADAFGEARRIGCELEIGPILIDQLAQADNAEDAISFRNGDFIATQFLTDQRFERFRHVMLSLKPDDTSAPPPLNGAAEEADKVFGFFFQFDVTVTDNAEQARAQQIEAGEEQPCVKPDHLLNRDIGRGPAWYAHEARQCRGDHDELADFLFVGAALQIEDHRHAEIGDEGKRMRRVQRLQCQDRENFVPEIGFKPRPVCLRHICTRNDTDALRCHFSPQLPPQKLLVRHQPVGFFPDQFELLGWDEAIDRHLFNTAHLLATQAGHTDHEELIEVSAGNRQEPKPFQQRVVGVLCFFQHAPVELQPADFPVEIARRRVRRFNGLGCRCFCARGHRVPNC